MLTRHLAISTVILAGIFTTFAIFHVITTPAQQMGGMETNPTPPVKGLYAGQAVIFIHTEASDAQVAAMLTRMMGPKVLVVPNLARIPRNLLADVYVFTNGVKGAGPFGFQADVFDAIPGQPRYTPLRSVVLVTWRTGIGPRLLSSAADIARAAGRGEVALQRGGVVVNMPMIAWPGGQR